MSLRLPSDRMNTVNNSPLELVNISNRKFMTRLCQIPIRIGRFRWILNFAFFNSIRDWNIFMFSIPVLRSDAPISIRASHFPLSLSLSFYVSLSKGNAPLIWFHVPHCIELDWMPVKYLFRTDRQLGSCQPIRSRFLLVFRARSWPAKAKLSYAKLN